MYIFNNKLSSLDFLLLGLSPRNSLISILIHKIRMDQQTHCRKLEQMYHNHPLNDVFKARVAISDKVAEITLDIGKHLFHAANAVHGAVYFKLLDDVAFFAANSIVYDVFLLTTSFNIYLTKPVFDGTLTGKGTLVNYNKRQYIAEAVLYNSEGMEISRGSGIYVASKIALSEKMGYKYR